MIKMKEHSAQMQFPTTAIHTHTQAVQPCEAASLFPIPTHLSSALCRHLAFCNRSLWGLCSESHNHTHSDCSDPPLCVLLPYLSGVPPPYRVTSGVQVFVQWPGNLPRVSQRSWVWNCLLEPGGLISAFRKSYLLFPGKSTAWVVKHTPSSHSKAMSDNLFLFLQSQQSSASQQKDRAI